jgi:hypothetical protein
LSIHSFTCAQLTIFFSRSKCFIVLLLVQGSPDLSGLLRI